MFFFGWGGGRWFVLIIGAEQDVMHALVRSSPQSRRVTKMGRLQAEFLAQGCWLVIHNAANYIRPQPKHHTALQMYYKPDAIPLPALGLQISDGIGTVSLVMFQPSPR